MYAVVYILKCVSHCTYSFACLIELTLYRRFGGILAAHSGAKLTLYWMFGRMHTVKTHSETKSHSECTL